jgi:hypothetical protein
MLVYQKCSTNMCLAACRKRRRNVMKIKDEQALDVNLVHWWLHAAPQH